MEFDHPPLMICEFLSTKSSHDPPEAFPSKVNRCTAGGGLDKLALDQQAELCLGPAHTNCPLRLKAKAAQFAPPLGAAEAISPDESEQTTMGQTKGSRKRRSQGEPVLPAIEEEFEPRLIEFEEESAEMESPLKGKANEETPSQPFRRELEDWLRGLFKNKQEK